MNYYEEKGIKLSLGNWFFIIGLALLIFINWKDIEPSQAIQLISCIFLTFPLVLLGIFVVSSVKKAIIIQYKKERDKINNEIIELRKKQNLISNIDQLIMLDEKILGLRQELKGKQNYRFIYCAIWAIILFVITIITTILNLGQYINIENRTLEIIFFVWGSYFIANMIKDLLNVFK